MQQSTTETKLTLGVKIRQMRLSLGLTQDQLLAGKYSKAYLSKVENNRVMPSIEFLSFVAAQLQVDISEFSEDAQALSAHSSSVQELALTNAHIAVEMRQYDVARRALATLVADKISPALQAHYYYLLGEVALGFGEYDVAVPELKRAYQLFELNSKSTEFDLARVANCLGVVYYRQNKFGLAIEQHRQSLNLLHEIGSNDTRLKMKVYYNLANAHSQNNEPDKGVEYYRLAAPLAEESEERRDLAGIYWGMGLAYYHKDDMALSKLYFDKSAKLYEELADLNLASRVRGNFGKTLIERGEYNAAISALDLALALARNYGDAAALALACTNLAYLYYKLERNEVAAPMAEEGLEHARLSRSNLLTGQALAQFAEIKIAQGVVEEGLALFGEAVVLLEKTDGVDYIKKTYFRFAEALERLGRLPEAIEKYRKAYSYH